MAQTSPGAFRVNEFPGLEQSTSYSEPVTITTEGQSPTQNWGVHIKFDWNRQGPRNPSKDIPASTYQLDWKPVTSTCKGICTVGQ